MNKELLTSLQNVIVYYCNMSVCSVLVL